MLVFISNTIEAQTIVSTEVYNNPNYLFEGTSRSDNGQFITITADNNSVESAVIYLLENQNDGTYNTILEYNNFIPDGGTHDVRVGKTPVADDGIMYNDYMQGWVGDDVLKIFEKIQPDGSNVTIFDYSNGGIGKLKIINGDLYFIMSVGHMFDPGTIGGLPMLLTNPGQPNTYVEYHLVKVDGNTNQYVWSYYFPSDSISWNSEILEMPNGNIAFYTGRNKNAQGVYFGTDKLIEFNAITGEKIGNIKEGNGGDNGDKYRFESDGNLHRLVTSQHKLIIYDVNDNYNSVVDSTDWSQNNLWSYGVDSWKTIDGKLYALRNDKILHLSNDLIHGYISESDLGVYGVGTQINWINNDGTFSYIKTDNGVVKIVTLFEENEDLSLLPTLNDSDPNIVAVFDGKVYDGNNWINAYHQSTIVFADGTLPSVGDTPDANWVTASPGTTILGFNPVEQSLRGDGHLIFRTGARKDGTTDVRNLKVFLVEESDVTLDNYVVSIAKVSDGSEPNTDTQFEISVSPTNTSGIAITGNISYAGTATEGVDYTGVSSFSIANGTSSVIITLPTIDDSEVEDTESIIATISGLSNGSLGTDNASADLYDDGDVGIDEIENSLSIYPNPASDYISVYSGNNTGKIEICDISGRVIIYNRGATQSRAPNNRQIDISNLNPGIYFIKLFTESGLFVRKFVKE